MSICLSFAGGAAIVAALSARVTTLLALITGLVAATGVMILVARQGPGDRLAVAGTVRSNAGRTGGAGLRFAVAAAFVAGALLAAGAWRAAGLPSAIDGSSVRLSGTALTVAPNGGPIDVRARFTSLPGSPSRTVQVYPGRDRPHITSGDCAVVSGTLTLPRPPGNPGGFDYAVYARATGSAGTVAADSIIVTRRAPLWRRLAGLPALAGERAAATLGRLFPEPQATLLRGLIFGGDSGELPAQQAADFRRAGLLHLLAASGSNVAFILGAAVWVLRRFLPNRSALAVGLGIVIAYWLMTGGGASIGRATLMAVIVIIGQLVRRRPDALTSLAVAAAVLTATNPLTALDAGFQLSFGATWGLLGISPAVRDWLRRRGVPDRLAAPLAVTLGAQAGVLPVAMNLFGEQSLVSPLTNLIALPLAGGAVVSGSVCCLLGAAWLPLAVPAAAVAALMLKLLTVSVALGARVPFAAVVLPAMPLWWAAAYYAWAVVAVSRARMGHQAEQRPARLAASSPAARTVIPAALALAVALIAVRPAHSGPGSGLRITFIDVRQGDSALIELPDGHRVLVDCGDFAAGGTSGADGSPFGAAGGKYDAAGRAIVPFLRRSNIRSLDAVIISHDHADHNGGLAGLRQAVHIGSLLTGADLTAGQAYAFGAAAVEVLWPPGSETADAPGNDDSIVLRLQYAGRSALLTGDIEAAAESALIAGGARLAADVLKVAHHGGAGSSGAAFLAAVQPRLAVISVGARNTFGHPSLEALARLAEARVLVLRTDRLGAVRVALEDDGMRIWHWNGRAWRAIRLTGTPPRAAKDSRHGLHCCQ